MDTDRMPRKILGMSFATFASLTLAGFAFIIISISFWATTRAGSPTQQTDVQAEELLASEEAIVSGDGSGVAFAAFTSVPASVELHIDPYSDFVAAMNTTDGISHAFLLNDLPPGEYSYYYSITANGKTTESDRYALDNIPQP